jgi:AraC-like DNA-binding protein
MSPLDIQNVEHFIEHPIIKYLYVIRIGHMDKIRNRFARRPVGVKNFLVMHCYSGKGWFYLPDQNKVLITKNTTIVVHPDVPYAHEVDNEDPWSFYYVHLGGELCQHYFRSPPNTYMIQHKVNTGEILDIFSKCVNMLEVETSEKTLIYSSNMVGQLLTLLMFFQHTASHLSIKNRYVDVAIQYMKNHIEDKITIQELCSELNVSKPNFIHMFKKTMGSTPIDFFVGLKIKKACEYLTMTDMSVKEISGKLGFTDPLYFSRVFSKYMRTSPTQYRNQ